MDMTAPNICRIQAVFAESARNFAASATLAPEVLAAATIVVEALRAGGTVMFCGNGGSAADSQHLAAELMGRYLIDRAPLRAVALTTDTSALTAIGNDYGFEHVFARQVAGLGRPGDVVIGLSTSGNSKNIVEALRVARGIGARTIGLTGAGGGAMAPWCDVVLKVPSTHTPRVQEIHIAIGHMICELAEAELTSDRSR